MTKSPKPTNPQPTKPTNPKPPTSANQQPTILPSALLNHPSSHSQQQRHGLKSKPELNAEWARVISEAEKGLGVFRKMGILLGFCSGC